MAAGECRLYRIVVGLRPGIIYSPVMDAWLARQIERWLDRARFVLLTGMIALFVWMILGASAAKPLWHDEIYTVLIARLPSVGAIWAAHHDGADLQPPLNTLLTAAAERVAGSAASWIRLPPLAGFILMTCAIAAMLRRRAGMTLALAGVFVPVQTAAYRYAYEARGYSLMLGLFTVALFAWAEASRGHRRRLWIPVCGASLGLAVWAHYYAAFGFLVIGAGELVRTIRTRQPDAAMLAALVAGSVLTLPLVPLILVATEQAPRFWARATDEDLASVYRFLFQPLTALMWSRLGGLLLLALAWTALTARHRRRPAPAPAAAAPVMDALLLHEVVALVLTAAAPVIMLVMARATGAPFVPRYTLIAVVGVAVGLPLLVRRLARRGSLAEVVLLGVLAAPLVQAVSTTTRPGLPPDPFAGRPQLAAALQRSPPVVASGSLTYLQLWYYAPPGERSSLVYLADPDAALRITGSDTFDRGYLALARWTAVPVQPYAGFLSAHPQFTVYAAGSGWLLTRLEEDHAAVALSATEPGGRVFSVER